MNIEANVNQNQNQNQNHNPSSVSAYFELDWLVIDDDDIILPILFVFLF